MVVYVIMHCCWFFVSNWTVHLLDSIPQLPGNHMLRWTVEMFELTIGKIHLHLVKQALLLLTMTMDVKGNNCL